MSSFRKFIIAAIAIAALAGAYGLLSERRSAAQREAAAQAAKPVAAPTVTVTRVETADFVETASVTGSLIAREEILVAPEIEGFRVLELYADEGSVVKKGDVLARLVATQLDAQMAQNEASLARANAAIAQAQSQIAQAEAQAREAKAQLDRAEPLKKSGYLSGATYDQRFSAARTTEAALVAARDGLKAAEADKAQVEAQRKEIAWRRDNTEVKAPADGVVSRRNARIGAAATAVGEPMFRIILKGEIELDAEIVETELGRVQEGQSATVTVPGAGDFEGKVRLVSPEVDKTTRLGRVKIFLGAKPSLRVGVFARGHIVTGRSRGLSAPAGALTFNPDGVSAQVVAGDRVETRTVKTGLIAGDRVEVTEGLKEGELIVTRAGTFLRDGDAVRAIIPDAKLSEAN